MTANKFRETTRKSKNNIFATGGSGVVVFSRGWSGGRGIRGRGERSKPT